MAPLHKSPCRAPCCAHHHTIEHWPIPGRAGIPTVIQPSREIIGQAGRQCNDSAEIDLQRCYIHSTQHKLVALNENRGALLLP
jgi:hypothetical protein